MQKKKNQDLTRGEEQIMQILWALGEGNVKDIIAKTDEPKPAYTTVATFMKILEEKGFVGRKFVGRSFTYYPKVDKQAYAARVLQSALSGYFNNSIVELVAYYNGMEAITDEERTALQEVIGK